jgi:hypothetical protein
MMEVTILILHFHCSLVELQSLGWLTSTELQSSLGKEKEYTCKKKTSIVSSYNRTHLQTIWIAINIVVNDFLCHAHVYTFKRESGEDKVENYQGHVTYCTADTFVL